MKAIVKMRNPKNKQELETLLGLLTYVSKFIPNLAIKNVTLRNLLIKDSVFLRDKNSEK